MLTLMEIRIHLFTVLYTDPDPQSFTRHCGTGWTQPGHSPLTFPSLLGSWLIILLEIATQDGHNQAVHPWLFPPSLAKRPSTILDSAGDSALSFPDFSLLAAPSVLGSGLSIVEQPQMFY